MSFGRQLDGFQSIGEEADVGDFTVSGYRVMKVVCPECESVEDVIRGRIVVHGKIIRTWSSRHPNGYRTAVDIETRCIGSGAIVKIVKGLDRRRG